MDSFIKMLNAQVSLLIYLSVGAYCAHKSIINQNAKQKLTDLILKITLPCMIFNSFNKPLTPDVLRETSLIFLVAMVVAIMSWLLGKILYRRYPREQQSILQYATLVNNSGFLGLPMVSAVYDTQGLFYASIFIIPNRIFMWTAGLSLFTVSDFKTKCRNILLNPCMIAVFLGIFRQMAGLSIPGAVETAVVNIGSLTTPLSMMVIGTMIAGFTVENMLDPSIFYLAFVRLVALPLIALGLLRLAGIDLLLTGIALILTGMPAGSTSALLAVKYGMDADFASRCVVITTLMSLITVPLLMLFI